MKASSRFEALTLGLMLALAGGSLDCYTYLNRGQVFATAETGNLVLVGVRLAQGRPDLALRYVPPILAYAAGVLAAELLRMALAEKRPDWRQAVLLLECGVTAGAALLPLGRLDPLANVLISFVSAAQVESFRTFAGCACATTMCTGNLRGGTEHLFRRWFQGDRSAGKKAAVYYSLIAAFVTGAVLSGILTALLGGGSAALPCVLLAASFWMLHAAAPPKPQAPQ